MSHRNTVFVSYSHLNKRWVRRLRVHLTPYEHSGLLDIWDDTRIQPGANWRAEIHQAIARAAASIILLSADFLASEFVVTHELPKLLARAERAGAKILPIIVEPVELLLHPELAAFQALNPPEKPLATMSRAASERVLAQAVGAIGKLVAVTPVATDVAERAGGTTVNGSPREEALFGELQAASIAFAILWALGNTAQKLTLSQLETALEIRSRKRAFEALERLAGQGWIEKSRVAGATVYGLQEKGVRQMQKLAAASDGPVRRAPTIR